MGCQFINNAHNKPISDVFNFNTNIQIGDAAQIFYSTLYTSKSTQEEDSKKQIQIGGAIIKRIKRLLEEKPHSISEDQSTDAMNQARKEPGFGEGLSKVLSGLNAATTRNVISATMAHLIPCYNGSQFLYSHDFLDLLVGQMEATLEGQDINVHLRSNKLGKKTITWPESLADDYIHQPIDKEFEQICFYDMTRLYKKNFKDIRIIDDKDKEGSGYKVKGVKKYKFKQSHPGCKFSHLTELKHHTIPRISLSKEKPCPVEEFELHLTNPTEGLLDNCEIYAKMALLMLCPF
jgi:hypothetical protein